MWSVAPVCGAKGIPAYIHPDDRALLSDPAKGLSLLAKQQFLGGMTFSEPDDVKELADGEVITMAGLDFTIAHVPGHTEGSVTFGTEPAAEEHRRHPLHRGPALRRLDRPDRPGRRRPREDAAQPGQDPDPARRHAGAARPRPADHDRHRARVEPLPHRSLPASPEGAVGRHDIPGAQGRLRVPAAPRRAVRGGARRVRRVRPPGLLRRRRDGRVRGHRAVRPRRRRVIGRGPQGDVLVHRPGRPGDHAAPGVHRGRAPRGARAQPAQGRAAGQGLHQRPRVPLRASPGRPLPAVLPVRPGGDRHRGPGGRRRDDRGRLGRLPVARPQPVHAAAEQPRRQDLPPGLPRGAAAVPARARPRFRHPAADRDQPAPGPRRQAPRGPRADRRTRR